MHHIAIMRKSWKLIDKILIGEKTIESRWYLSRSAPWDRIHAGDTVFLKNSGEQVTAKAEVEKVLQFSDLSPDKVRTLLDKYASKLGIPQESIPKFYDRFKNKRYCILIFLKNPEKIKPFEINKSGFGLMAAWMTVADINQIKK